MLSFCQAQTCKPEFVVFMFSVTKKKSSLFNASQCKKFFPLSIKKKKKEKQIALDLNVYIVISHLDETLGVIY